MLVWDFSRIRQGGFDALSAHSSSLVHVTDTLSQVQYLRVALTFHGIKPRLNARTLACL